jgi:hypothetical protein
MFANDDYFEKWMQKLYNEIHDITKYFRALNGEKEISGEDEKLLDKQNLSKIINVSHRTLQHYRSERALPFLKRRQKIYSKASAVREFVNQSGFYYWDKKAIDDAVRAKKQ